MINVNVGNSAESKSIRDTWHPCRLQSINNTRFVEVVNKILAQEYALLKIDGGGIRSPRLASFD